MCCCLRRVAHTAPARSHVAAMQQQRSRRCKCQDELSGLYFSVTLDLVLRFMLSLEKFTFLPLHSYSAYPKQAPRAGFISLWWTSAHFAFTQESTSVLSRTTPLIHSFISTPASFLGPVFYSFICESFPVTSNLLSQLPGPPYWRLQCMKINLVIFPNTLCFQISHPEIMLTQ